MLNTEQLLDFLKTGMGTAQQVSDELLRQFLNYLFVSTALHAVTIGIIFWFLYASLSKGIKLLAEDTVSQQWALALKAVRVVLVVGTIGYSYNSISAVIEPMVAPHVWLIKQGVKIVK